MLLIYLPFLKQRQLFNRYLESMPYLKAMPITFDYRHCPKSVYCNESIQMRDADNNSYLPVCDKCRVPIDTQDWNERHIFNTQEPETNILAVSDWWRFPTSRQCREEATLSNIDIHPPELICSIPSTSMPRPELYTILKHVDLAIYLSSPPPDLVYNRQFDDWIINDPAVITRFLYSSTGSKLLKERRDEGSSVSRNLVRSYLIDRQTRSLGSPI